MTASVANIPFGNVTEPALHRKVITLSDKQATIIPDYVLDCLTFQVIQAGNHVGGGTLIPESAVDKPDISIALVFELWLKALNIPPPRTI